MNRLSQRWVGVGLTIAVAVLMSRAVAAEANAAAEYRQQGLQYRQVGQFAEALQALQTAVSLEPDNLSGRVLLGWTLHLDQQDRAAADVLEANLQQNLFHVPTLNALGIIYLMNDDPLAAAGIHTWATLLKPDNEIAHYNLSLAFERLQQYDWAIQAAKRAVRLEPENPHPLLALAVAQLQLGNSTQARESYQQAIALDSRYSEPAFLTDLTEAGFSAKQIVLAQQVLQAL